MWRYQGSLETEALAIPNRIALRPFSRRLNAVNSDTDSVKGRAGTSLRICLSRSLTAAPTTFPEFSVPQDQTVLSLSRITTTGCSEWEIQSGRELLSVLERIQCKRSMSLQSQAPQVYPACSYLCALLDHLQSCHWAARDGDTAFL